tara:strand:- start:8305 stop:9471 length:1167 start_codon:yes stop_codon:yes gene_type:complete
MRQFQYYKKEILFFSLTLNLFVLGYFKYANFFVSEFLSAFDLLNNFNLENIILPVGISFYIFQSFTYVLDVYFRKIEPEKSPVNYFTFIAFFPQLVAGPIERASSLLPQFSTLKGIDRSSLGDGIKICIIGLFLKIFIADNIAGGVDHIFGNYQDYNGGTLLLGALGFTIQIYGDFCGYSLIAIGVAKIMGFELMRNFDTPYLSTSIQDFWRRWHISLSTFFRDYVYIPLGGSRVHESKVKRNLIITFMVSGVWHGANWTFMFWGVIHGILLVIQRTMNLKVKNFLGWLITMTMVVILWILFRSESITDFYLFTRQIIINPGMPETRRAIAVLFIYSFLLDFLLFRYKEQGLTWYGSEFLETFSLATMLILVIGTINSDTLNFIYFQF